MTQEDYDEYEEGYEAGKDAAEEAEEASTMDLVEDQVKRLVISDPYGHKSEMWRKGFEHGKEGNWEPPEVDGDGETDEESE